MQRSLRLSLVLRRIATGALACSLLVGPALTEAAISQGYRAPQGTQSGSLVSLDLKEAGKIELANRDNHNNLIGVVVNAGTNLINLSNGADESQVISTGNALAIVSTLNGDIKAGDRIAPTVINGVGAKATERGKIIGIAQADFNGKSERAKQQTVNVGGQSKQIAIGQSPVAIEIGFFDIKQTDEETIVPKFLQDISNTVAGKQVQPIKVIIATLILMIATISVAVLLYGAMRFSIISIGRNPLSQGAIRRSLFQVLFISMAIMITALAVVYLTFKT